MIFAGIYIAGGVVFFCSPALLQLVCNRQGQFIQMVWAKSYIATTPLEPNFKSFIRHFPFAFDIAFCRPYLWNSYNLLYMAGGIEVLALAVIVVYGIVKNIFLKLGIFKTPLVFVLLVRKPFYHDFYWLYHTYIRRRHKIPNSLFTPADYSFFMRHALEKNFSGAATLL